MLFIVMQEYSVSGRIYVVIFAIILFMSSWISQSYQIIFMLLDYFLSLNVFGHEIKRMNDAAKSSIHDEFFHPSLARGKGK